MAAAMRRMRERIAIVDVVIEAIDARVPLSGVNPAIETLIGSRQRLRVLTRDDLADPSVTKRWLQTLARSAVLAVDTRDAGNVRALRTALERLLGSDSGMRRAMVVGIPNSGKSTLINALLGRSSARTEMRAGITRRLQWFRVAPKLELMDTPGILPPKIAGAEAQWKLALTGAVPPERYDAEAAVQQFTDWAGRRTYKSVVTLERFAAARGFLRRGGEADMSNAARAYIKEFNEGRFGRISLEFAPDDAEAA